MMQYVLDKHNIDGMELICEEKFHKIGDQFSKDIAAILLNNRYHRLKKNTLDVHQVIEDRFIYVMLLNCIE